MKLTALFFLFVPLCLQAQKKPLDHTVYDSWQSIGERLLSNDGRWVVYTVTPQEGDAELYIQSAHTPQSYSKKIPRGYNAVITEDNRYVVFKIRPYYKDTREARIRKRKPDDFPKDSLAILSLESDSLWKWANIKSYKTPRKNSGWVAYQREPIKSKTIGVVTEKTVDSLRHTIDSLLLLVKEIKNVKGGNADPPDADEEPANTVSATEGSDLVLRNLITNEEQVFKNVADYYFNAYGQKLLLKAVKEARDSSGTNAVLLYDMATKTLDTITKGGNDFRNFALTEDGSKAAFIAQRPLYPKEPQKSFQLYLYRSGDDSATVLVDKKTPGMQLGTTVSEFGATLFSKSGNRLLFGIVPVPPAKDTSLPDIDLVKLDVWNYKDDYLQSQQLFNLATELKRSYLAVYDFTQEAVHPLGSKEMPTIIPTNEGDGNIFIGVTDTGRRVEAQWTGNTKKDIYAIDVRSGTRTLVRQNVNGSIYPSATGRYILWYDYTARRYFVWNGKEVQPIASAIKVPLYNEDYDMPDDPTPYGIMAWHQKDSFVYVYDKYNVWKVDPENKIAPKALFSSARENNISYRYIKVDSAEKFIPYNQKLFFRAFDPKSKQSAIGIYDNVHLSFFNLTAFDDHSYATFVKAKDTSVFLYSKENYIQPPNLYLTALNKDFGADVSGPHSAGLGADQLTHLNPQQAKYNWGTAELYHWQTFDGKRATGILYKPEDFNPGKKYPMLIYFYEKLSDNIYQYIAPAPTPSRLNIPFFVSRGYLVFTPDISYTKGHPGNDAYNYIVSGAQALAKNSWVDAKNMGLQGQSWGGYQVAYLVTRTGMFKAAWAGAPVANMTSAYGGIRWESGVTRQFQYEKGQSRIGATVWERPDLYIENSPLFHLPKVTTPLVIMSNDADGAVPWYQGIELFTAMRRLGKKVWLLSYNGEAHNLVERKNRKDIQLREQQYFDWMLKGEKPARWLTQGIPAVNKGKDWGLDETK